MIKNKTVLITGATKGIGRAIAMALATKGYHLLLTAQQEVTLAELCQVFTREYPEIHVEYWAGDLSSDKALNELLRWVNDQQIDILVNNVGIYIPSSILDETEDSFRTQWQVNYIVPYRLSQIVGRQMQHRKRGHIFNVTSVAAKTPVFAAGTYSVTKSALHSLTCILRDELREHGVRVTEIVPGSTKTASWEGTSLPEDRFVMPEDVAEAVALALTLTDGASLDEITIVPQQGNI